jgi:hypothetical protein
MSPDNVAASLVEAAFYCGSFAKGDPRIEHALAAVESALGRRLTHYFHHRSGKPKAIPGDRTEFVSQWLPGLNEKLGSQQLCLKSADEPLVLVTLDNILTLPELLVRRGGPYNGAVHVTVTRGGPFTNRLVKNFAALIAGTGCFHATFRAPPLSGQEPFTRQRLAAREREIEKLRAQSEELVEVNRKLLLSEADKYVYDLDERPLTGVTPDGQAFTLRLFWLNYWNDATAQRLGFPDKTVDKPLEGLYERLAAGWLVKLTADPTDLNQPGDRERLQWAYDRFAGHGG